MKQFVCNYAPVRFLPYREVGEFANVGVVVHCPQTDFFGYRLIPLQRTRRVTRFFPDLDEKFLSAALSGLDRELARLQGAHRLTPGEISPEAAKAHSIRFGEVIRRREGVLHFGEAGTLLAETPALALDQLYERFVERQLPHEVKDHGLSLRDSEAA
jgi:hypothetical protein